MTQTLGMIEGVCMTAAPTLNGYKRDLTNAHWNQGAELRLNHTFQCIGKITDIWRDRNELKFLASVSNPDIWTRIEAGEITACSIEAGHDVEFEKSDGLTHVKEWSITAISLLTPDIAPGCPEAGIIKLHHGSVPTPPALPVVRAPAPIDPKAAQLASYAARAREIKASIDRIENQLLTDGLDHSIHKGLQAALPALKAEFEALIERKTLLEAGMLLPEPANDHETAPTHATEQTKAAPAKARKRRAWEVKDLPEPKYPAGARARGDQEALDKAFDEFVDYEINGLWRRFSKDGANPDQFVTLHEALVILGKSHAQHIWHVHRFKELESRVSELQDNQQRFCGPHNRAQSYSKGNMVVHGGGLWVAITPADVGAIPGQDPAWMLAVKKGTFDE